MPHWLISNYKISININDTCLFMIKLHPLTCKRQDCYNTTWPNYTRCCLWHDTDKSKIQIWPPQGYSITSPYIWVMACLLCFSLEKYHIIQRFNYISYSIWMLDNLVILVLCFFFFKYRCEQWLPFKATSCSVPSEAITHNGWSGWKWRSVECHQVTGELLPI